MFESLSDRLSGVFDRLRGRGALSEGDVREAMREVRIALLEADVALPVARKFIDAVTEKAVGQQVLRSVTPGQQVVKIVNDALVEMLGGAEPAPLELTATPPVVILLVGLQDSGKTTTTAKLAKLLKEKHGKKAMMASLLKYQAEDGLWRQLVDRPDVWAETSGTGMFAFALWDDRARELSEHPAWIRGIDHRIDPQGIGLRDLTTAPSAALAAEKAGVGNGPVDVAELHAPFTHQEVLLRAALGLGDDVNVNPSGGSLAANPMIAAGLVRIGEAAGRISRGEAGRAVAHATSGPCLQQNLVCVLEGGN